MFGLDSTRGLCLGQKSVEIDNTFLPISEIQLVSDMKTTRSEAALVDLCDRAARRGLLATAQQTLSRLCDTHPKDLLYLGAYWYSIRSGGSSALANSYLETRDKVLALKGLDQSYWLPLVMEARFQAGRAATPTETTSAIGLFRRAIQVAPNVSIPHLYLEEYYLSLSNDGWDGHKFGPQHEHYLKLAARELSTTDKLEPARCDVFNKRIWFDLFVYKSNEKAREDKRHFLAMAPDPSALYPGERQILALVK